MGQEIRSQLGILTTEEVASSLEVTEHTLAMWRSEGKGPKFVRLGRGIFYRRADVQEWIDKSVVSVAASAEARV